jgi:hypothetical protein
VGIRQRQSQCSFNSKLLAHGHHLQTVTIIWTEVCWRGCDTVSYANWPCQSWIPPTLIGENVMRLYMGLLTADWFPSLGSTVFEDPLDGVAVEFGTVLQIEFDLQLLAIRVDRMHAQVKIFGNGTGGRTLANERQYFQLAV